MTQAHPDTVIETYLALLDGEHGCGEPLLYENIYDEIQQAGRGGQRGPDDGEPKRPDWHKVEQLCKSVLTGRSKDLQVVAWLGEAWIANDGIAGALQAVKLMRKLCATFWEGLHPMPRNGDMEFRTRPVDWADTHWTESAILRLVLVQGVGPDARDYTLNDWRDAHDLDAVAGKSKAALKGLAERGGKPTLERIRQNVASMPIGKLSDALGALYRWRTEIAALETELERRLPRQGPTLRTLKPVLFEIEEMLQACLAGHPRHVHASDIQFQQNDAPGMPAVLAEPVTSRADAYRKLDAIANWLAGIEPHSPVPSLIRRALVLGKMPFDELLTELTKNNGELQKFLLSK